MMRYLFILLLLPFVAQGQTTYKILADSTRLGHINNAGNELILENDTRDSLGVIANIGNGRTQFKALRLQQLTDSTFRLLLGNTTQGQTITIRGIGGGGATYTLTKNASKDSIILTGSNGTRYAVFDTLGVPYTGATNSVNLGNNDLEARNIKITGTNGGGYLQLKNQTGPLPSPPSTLIFYSDPSGNISYVNNSNTAIFQIDGITNNRTYRMPDSSGTVALLSNIKSIVSYGKNATRDSVILLLSDGTRYAVLDSTGDGALLLDTTNVSYYTVISTLNTPPISPAVGATYAIGNSPTGAWVGKSKNIAEWNGASWDFTAPVQGDYYYDQASGYTYQYRSGVWVRTSSIPVLVNGQSLSSGVLLGTNNSQSLTFETNNVRRSRIDSIGRFYVYNVPTSTDTFFVAYNSTGRFTKVGKSGLPNIYTTDGIIQDGTNRVVDVQGSLTIADTSIEGFDNFYSFIGIGDSIGIPDGLGGYIYLPSNGAAQYSLFSNGNNKTAFASVSSSGVGGGLATANLVNDITTDETIGQINAYDTSSTKLLSFNYYTNPVTDEYIGMYLTEDDGFNIYPYLPGAGTSTYKKNSVFSVYDTTQALVFNVATDGAVSADVFSATSVQIEGTNGNGHINLKHQANDATATGSSTALFADNNGDLKYKNDNLYYTTLKTSGNTADRTYRFPDSSGTIALTSNIQWELLSTATINNTTTVEFTGLSSTYSIYRVYFDTVSIPNPATASLKLEMGYGSTPTYYTGASDYRYSFEWTYVNSAQVNGNFGTGSGKYNASNILLLEATGNTPVSFSGYIDFYYLGGSAYKIMNGIYTKIDDLNPYYSLVTYTGGGVLLKTTAITALKFSMTSGNLTSGSFKLYGFK